MKEITIEGHKIGLGNPAFIIAEAGVNHNGNIELAKKLVDVAVESGADAVKFQTFTSTELVVPSGGLCEYQEKNLSENTSQLSMLENLELSLSHFKILKEYCDSKGMIFMSTPHTPDVLNYLNNLVPAFKIGSGDLNNFPLLRQVARFDKPIILGTGMATLDEVKNAISIIQNEGNDKIIVLHCTTNYPCPLNEVNLKAMNTMDQALNSLVGYSDHTEGIQVSIIARAMGAVCIEKHFTLDKNLEGPDHKASLDPKELKEMIIQIRQVDTLLGYSEKKPNNSEQRIMQKIRKSIVASRDIPAGSIISEDDLAIKRPGTGLPPSELTSLIGKKSASLINKDTLILWDNVLE